MSKQSKCSNLSLISFIYRLQSTVENQKKIDVFKASDNYCKQFRRRAINITELSIAHKRCATQVMDVFVCSSITTLPHTGYADRYPAQDTATIKTNINICLIIFQVCHNLVLTQLQSDHIVTSFYSTIRIDIITFYK